MATDTTAAVSHGSEEVLLDSRAYIVDDIIGAVAKNFTRNGKVIMASLLRCSPPHRSCLSIHSPDLDSSAFSQLSRIVCMVEGLILIRVAISCPPPIWNKECDYFIFRAHRPDPELHLLPHPAPVCFHDDEVGLLPRGNDYSVAALVATGNSSVFTLRLFDSSIWSWTSITLTLQAPPRGFPIKIPKRASRLFDHYTSTVVTLGGERGTMGWVDLWSGILLCDVLDPHPVLRHVRLPLPMERLKFDDGKGYRLGRPKPYRDITFIKEKGCLRLVDLHVTGRRLLEESGAISFRIDSWTITTWSNVRLTGSFDDWVEDCSPLDAKEIHFSEQMHKLLLGYGLLHSEPSPQDKSVAAGTVRNLENLWVYRPTLSMTGSNVVYLMAMAKFNHPDACVLAIDLESKKLQRIAYFGTKRELGSDIIFRHGSFSKNGRNPPISIVSDHSPEMMALEVEQEFELWCQGYKD